eukprot:gene10899-biopygen7799
MGASLKAHSRWNRRELEEEGRGGGRGFSGAHPGAQIRASRRASTPTRRAARARRGGGWDRRLVQLSNDGLGAPPSSFLASATVEPLLSRNSAFAPRCEPPRARAPGPQMIWMAPGSSLAFQRMSRDTPNCILSVLFAETMLFCRLRDSFVTDSQGVPDDVRGLGGRGIT